MFKWYSTYNEEKCPFYNKKDCIKAIKKISDVYIYEDDDEKMKYLNSVNNKIPNTNLMRFYGGKRKEYLTD